MAHDRPSKRRRLSEDQESSDSTIADALGSIPTEAAVTNSAAMSMCTPAPPRIRAKHTIAEQNQTLSVHDDASDSTGIASSATTSSGSFAALGLDQWLVTALSHMSITHPTRIQKSCIPAILRGYDCIGGSRTGSGKTIAFSGPILHQWARDPSGIFAVVLTPTRELALQIFEQIQALGGSQGVKAVLVTGGADMRAQALALGRRPHLVIATPGRLADHILNSGADTMYGLRKCRFVVLDEADRLLASGKGSMLPDVETCLDALPPPTMRQTCLFTATVTPEVRALKEARRATSRLPVFVSEIGSEVLKRSENDEDLSAATLNDQQLTSALPPTLTQTYQLVNVLHKEKYLHVLLLTPANLDKTAIIFCNRTTTATVLEHLLRLLEHRVTSLHSGLAQAQRTANLARFRARAARILISTDLGSRGLDIPQVELVINYDLPRDPDDYVHRVGRTARAGRRGTSVSFVGPRDVALIHAIERRTASRLDAYAEPDVNLETRVVRDALNLVAEKKREAFLAIDEGRDVQGRRGRKMSKMAG